MTHDEGLLVKKFSDMIFFIYKKHFPRGIVGADRADILSAGHEAIIRAIRRYDKTKNASETTFIYEYIKYYLKKLNFTINCRKKISAVRTLYLDDLSDGKMSYIDKNFRIFDENLEGFPSIHALREALHVLSPLERRIVDCVLSGESVSKASVREGFTRMRGHEIYKRSKKKIKNELIRRGFSYDSR